MRHTFMAAVSDGLAKRSVSTLRYHFPYLEAGSKRVDRPSLAQITVRAAVTVAGNSVPLFAGGKSFARRMTSQRQAIGPMPGICGLVFFGFPLHPAGKPSVDRAAHLSDVHVPMLLLQGTRDALAENSLIETVVDDLGPAASFVSVPNADHGFHVPAKTGLTDGHILEAMLNETTAWMGKIVRAAS
jgi:predicted alpha/beta-hydrolase family hydrolase